MIKYKTLDLTKIDTIVLHNRSEIRRNHIETIMMGKKINYRLFPCLKHKDRYISAILSIIHIFKEASKKPIFEPFMFLEDDVNLNADFNIEITYPEDADCIYLGLSRGFSTFKDYPRYKWTVIDDNLVKIGDMLSTHAFVVTSVKWLNKIIELMTDTLDNPTNYDIPIARIQHKFNIYGLKRPFFYQDSKVGGQERPTRITFDNIKHIVLSDNLLEKKCKRDSCNFEIHSNLNNNNGNYCCNMCYNDIGHGSGCEKIAAS